MSTIERWEWTFRKRYTEAKDQLLSGENFFKDVISPLSDLLDDWRYFGFVCFPEVENKDILRKLTYDDGIFFTEERLKVHFESSSYITYLIIKKLEYSDQGGVGR